MGAGAFIRSFNNISLVWRKLFVPIMTVVKTKEYSRKMGGIVTAALTKRRTNKLISGKSPTSMVENIKTFCSVYNAAVKAASFTIFGQFTSR